MSIFVCIYIYIFIYLCGSPPPPRPMDLPFSCVWEVPPHENGGSLRGGASRWTITSLWLGELHPGPIEFNRGRLSSIGGRIED